MKKLLKSTLLPLALISFLGFKIGEDIELEQFVNARTNPVFTKNTRNIRTVLSKGTTGKVADLKRFNSGNYGILLSVTSGPQTGKKYWVYYDKDKPAMVIKNKNEEIKPPEIEPEELERKDPPKSELTEDQMGIRDPKDGAMDTIVEESMDYLRKLDLLTNPLGSEIKCKDITDDPLKQPEAEIIPEQKEDSEVQEISLDSNDIIIPESTEQAQEDLNARLVVKPQPQREEEKDSSTPELTYVSPEKTRPTQARSSYVCRTVQSSFDQCHVGDESNVQGFKIQNYGPNKIVKTNEYYISRSYEIEFPDKASSDMKMFVVDSPSDRTSHSTYNLMLFFPRTVQPSVKKVGNELIVTLPNKEVVKYDATTKEIIGGVLSEAPMTQASSKTPAIPNKVKYEGNNVIIRASKSGDLPYGDIELKNGKPAPSTTTATISKKGHKDCQVPSKDLWYNDNKINSILIKPEFATDEGLDAFIKKKCGFSLF